MRVGRGVGCVGWGWVTASLQKWDKYGILQQHRWLTTRWHNPTQLEALRPQTATTSWWEHSSWRWGNKGWSVKWCGVRWWNDSEMSKKKKNAPVKRRKISVDFQSAWVFFFFHCGRDEITGWPITWVATRTLLWNSDYYWQCGTCSTAPSNPLACGWSCGMLLTSLISPDPPLKATWLAQGPSHWLGRRFLVEQREGVVRAERGIKNWLCWIWTCYSRIKWLTRINRLKLVRWFFIKSMAANAKDRWGEERSVKREEIAL